MSFKLRYLIIFLVFTIVLAGGFYIYKKQTTPSYAYTLAEFVQKQQTFSPYTKYEPSFAIDKARGKIYYVFKAMDDNDIWQIWTAVSDLDGNNWQETKQTDSPENKQRPAIVYDSKDDLIHYFYRTGNEMGASEKITRRLITAVKNPNEEKWHNEKELVGDDGIDDTVGLALDSARHDLIFIYTKNNQITTALMDLDKGTFKETVHTQTAEMNFIPNMAYDDFGGTVYIVFPRARTAGTFNNKDIWLAKVNGDGSNYREVRLTETDYDNTWPFITLDLPRQQFYVSYSFFDEPIVYSEEGVGNVEEKPGFGRANLDGSGWELRPSVGMRIYGIDPKTGVIYGTYGKPLGEPIQMKGVERYFVAYDFDKNNLKKQLIPSGDRFTDYDAAFRTWDSETGRLFGAQQVCRNAEERGIECQVWTYTGRVLRKMEKSTLPAQTSVEMAKAQPRQLPELKIIGVQAVGNKIKINTNRKLSMPVEIKVTSNGQEIRWEPRQLSQVDQDKGIELRFDNPMTSYEVSYRVCALSDTSKPECEEGTVSYSGPGEGIQTAAPGVFEGQDFKITIPEGWVRTNQAQGVLLIIVKADETHPEEPNIQAINFKSYIAVASDKTNGKSVNQLAEESKNEIIESIPGSQVAISKDEIISNMPAKFYEFDVPQQDINFKVLLAIVAKEDKVFVISFNTTAGKWPAYGDIFYQMAKSFEFKY